MRNIYKYTKLYSNNKPIFEEGEVFRTIIPIKHISIYKVGEKKGIDELKNTEYVDESGIKSMPNDNFDDITKGNIIKELNNVAHNVVHDVAHSVAHDVVLKSMDIDNIIKDMIKENNRVSRKVIAKRAGVSVKTIERHIKNIDNLKYIGSGKYGYWDLKE